jgi:hypothetical protein
LVLEFDLVLLLDSGFGAALFDEDSLESLLLAPLPDRFEGPE